MGWNEISAGFQWYSLCCPILLLVMVRFELTDKSHPRSGIWIMKCIKFCLEFRLWFCRRNLRVILNAMSARYKIARFSFDVPRVSHQIYFFSLSSSSFPNCWSLQFDKCSILIISSPHNTYMLYDNTQYTSCCNMVENRCCHCCWVIILVIHMCLCTWSFAGQSLSLNKYRIALFQSNLTSTTKDIFFFPDIGMYSHTFDRDFSS